LFFSFKYLLNFCWVFADLFILFCVFNFFFFYGLWTLFRDFFWVPSPFWVFEIYFSFFKLLRTLFLLILNFYLDFLLLISVFFSFFLCFFFWLFFCFSFGSFSVSFLALFMFIFWSALLCSTHLLWLRLDFSFFLFFVLVSLLMILAIRVRNVSFEVFVVYLFFRILVFFIYLRDSSILTWDQHKDLREFSSHMSQPNC